MPPETAVPTLYRFIINPTAGKHRSEAVERAIEIRFAALGGSHSIEIHRTERPGHATEIARGIGMRDGAAAVVFACGGDGTVNEVVNGLAGTGAALGVLPCGTGNDFVRTVYETRDIDGILARIDSHGYRYIDAARFNDQLFVNVASLGFDTIVGLKAKAMVAKAPWIGGISYGIAAVAGLTGQHSFPMELDIEVDSGNGETTRVLRTEPFTLMAICNGGYYGGGFHPAPLADAADGLLDICVVRKLGALKILSLIPRYAAGTHMGNPAVTMYKVRKGIIRKVGDKLAVNCDGESSYEDAISFEVLPGSIRLAVF
jgi:YegS/Rv2252/BmrU family lipid kinase